MAHAYGPTARFCLSLLRIALICSLLFAPLSTFAQQPTAGSTCFGIDSYQEWETHLNFAWSGAGNKTYSGNTTDTLNAQAFADVTINWHVPDKPQLPGLRCVHSMAAVNFLNAGIANTRGAHGRIALSKATMKFSLATPII